MLRILFKVSRHGGSALDTGGSTPDRDGSEPDASGSELDTFE